MLWRNKDVYKKRRSNRISLTRVRAAILLRTAYFRRDVDSPPRWHTVRSCGCDRQQISDINATANLFLTTAAHARRGTTRPFDHCRRWAETQDELNVEERLVSWLCKFCFAFFPVFFATSYSLVHC